MRLFRWALRAYPREARDRYGEEMEQLFREELADARRAESSWTRVRLWSVTLGGVIARGLIERSRGVLEGFSYEFGHALRHAARHKTASGATILTYAMAIGVFAAAFSLVSAVLLRPLPYHSPERLAVLSTVDGEGAVPEPTLSAPDFLAIQRDTKVFANVAGAVGFTAPLEGERGAVEVRTAMVTWNFFPLLGVDPVLGGHFREEEQGPGKRLALITHDLWRDHFAEDHGIVGRTLRMTGSDVEIVGVLPDDFVFYAPDGSGASISMTDDLKVWELFSFDIDGFRRNSRFLTTVARTRPGVTWAEVEAEVGGFGADLRDRLPEYQSRSISFLAIPYRDAVVGRANVALWGLFGAAVVVVLIAIVNLVALGYARAEARAAEYRVRAALGAERRRILRMTLLESTALATLGSCVGTVIASLLIDGVRVVGPEGVPRLAGASVDSGVLALAIMVALAAAIPVGVVPLVNAGRGATNPGRRGRTSRTHWLFRHGLVGGQVALCLCLLVATGLLMRTFAGVMTVDRGYDLGRSTLSFFPAMGTFRGWSDEEILAFHTGLTDRLRQHPLVSEVGTTTQLPLTGPVTQRSVAFDAASEYDWGSVRVESLTVSERYFEAIGTPIVGGRGFTPADDRSAPLVVVVDERFAERAWPGADPIGQRLVVDAGANGVIDRGPTVATVVGVARTVRDDRLSVGDGPGRIYLAFRQQPGLTVFYAIRTSGPSEPVLAATRAAINEFDPSIALTRISTLAALKEAATSRERLAFLLMVVYAAVALGLALVGVYGVVAFAVRHRAREYGLRLALGARPASVVATVLASGLTPAAYGVGIGIGISVLTGKAIEGLLFGVSPMDPATYALAALGLAVTVALACTLPALRTLSIEPAVVLAEE